MGWSGPIETRTRWGIPLKQTTALPRDRRGWDTGAPDGGRALAVCLPPAPPAGDAAHCHSQAPTGFAVAAAVATGAGARLEAPTLSPCWRAGVCSRCRRWRAVARCRCRRAGAGGTAVPRRRLRGRHRRPPSPAHGPTARRQIDGGRCAPLGAAPSPPLRRVQAAATQSNSCKVGGGDRAPGRAQTATPMAGGPGGGVPTPPAGPVRPSSLPSQRGRKGCKRLDDGGGLLQTGAHTRARSQSEQRAGCGQGDGLVADLTVARLTNISPNHTVCLNGIGSTGFSWHAASGEDTNRGSRLVYTQRFGTLNGPQVTRQECAGH